MSTTALVEREPIAPVVTGDQLELIKRTVANGATADELKLYLYDCARQGVHPLDKLLHFTKRGGKYTPVTSIDLMRTRAADTGEYAGSDDAEFDPTPSAGMGTGSPRWATVRVWRLVQGQRCPFTATARWSEYCPAAGQDHMWRKMPHTMLAKCAEALALRKGFPRQLAGLYAKEELDQADSPRWSLGGAVDTCASDEVPSEPEGYAAWVDGLEDVAVEGFARLQVTFQQSPRAFREYLTKHDPARHQALKTKAIAIDQAKANRTIDQANSTP